MKRFIMTALYKIYNWPLFRFAIVGVINTVIGMGIMFGLYNLAGCSFWVSTAANYILTSILSYFLNKYFTFKNEGRSLLQALGFAFNIAACYLIANGAAKPLTAFVLSGVDEKLRENIAMLVGQVMFSALNYLGQRLIVFKKQNGQNG